MSTATTRARLGVIVPSVNTVVEPWFSHVCPPGVTVHAARMFLDANLTREALVRMDREEGMQGVKQIMSCKPASVAYCCTASSIVQGLEYDGRLNHELQHAAGVPTFTATSAIIDALHVVGAKRLSICSPYTKAIDDAEHVFFSAAGYHRCVCAGRSHARSYLRAMEKIVACERRRVVDYLPEYEFAGCGGTD